MDTHNAVLSPGYVLNEQLASQIFETLPEQGPIVIILDRQGNCWPSDSEEFAKLRTEESFLKELCAKVDDGTEPVITQLDDVTITAAQLSTEQTNCGFVIIALPRYNLESTLVNIDLVETLINLISLTATLIEKNTHLYELQAKNYSIHREGDVPTN
jgi:hypothetical protein